MNQFHLTQYNQNNTYVKSQIFDLAEKMGAVAKEQGEVKLNQHRIYVSNHIVGFTFILSKLDTRKDCDAHYYQLAVKDRYLGPIVGAKVIMSCNGINNIYKQGAIATLTRNEGASGWWAEFEDGQEWNVGSGYDFIVFSSGMERVRVSVNAAPDINAMSPSVKKKFDVAVAKFEKKLSSKETLNIISWVHGVIYFEVKDLTKGVYPSDTRFLSSFNCETGEFYNGTYKHAVVRRGWGKFAENLLGLKLTLQGG
ncbi:hypothetical protein [Shewanella marisflavi]|uniref:hypothetical protein n=1 Tax=Shewanella marisflavi TaxID=260364 RepID=UPI003AAD4B04